MATKKDTRKTTPVAEEKRTSALKSAALGSVGILGVGIGFVGIKVPFAESLAKEHWRAGTVTLLLIILMIPAAIGLFLFMVDANQFKAEIVQFVKVQTQRDLVLQGDIKVKFFPKLGLELGRMSLSQRNSAKEFASVNNARLSVALWPLLRKQLVFDRVEIDGLRANLTRLTDGTTNYDDLLIRDENIAPMTFDIDSVRISHSAINWQDEMKWQRVALQDLQLETGRLADAVPGHVSASFHIDSEKLRSNGNVEVQSSLFYERKTGRLEFADIDAKLEGDSAWINNVTLNFKGSLEGYPATGTLTAENVNVTLSGKSGQRNIEVRLITPKLQFAQNKLSGGVINVETTTSLSDETWKVAMQIPEFSALERLFNSPNTTATFDLKGEGHSLQGKLAGAFTLDLQESPKLRFDNLVATMAGRHPALANELVASVSGSAQVDIAEQTLKLDLNAKVDDTVITGSAGLKDFSRPAYTFELNANHLDLDRYLASDWLKHWRDDATAFDVSDLKGLNLNGNLRAGEVKLNDRRVSKFVAGIKVDQATLTIAPLAGYLYGGVVSGSISVAAQGVPKVAIKQTLRGFKVDGLYADAAGNDRLTGRGDAALDVSAEGASIGALRKSMSGTASMSVAHGTLAGTDLRAALLAGKSDLGSKNAERVSAAKFTDKTDFTELKALFNIKEGSSSGNSFEMRSPLLAVAGEGEYAPDTGNLTYRLNTTVAAKLNRRTAGELADLKGITVPLRVSGTFAAPTLALDFAAASGGNVAQLSAAYAARQAALAAASAAAATGTLATPAVSPPQSVARPAVKPHKKKVQ